MTAPVVAARASGTSASASQHIMTMPGSISAGDLLLVVFTKSGLNAPIIDLTASGPKWWRGPSVSQSGTGVTQTVFAKKAEGGDALTLETTANNVSTHISLRITGWAAVTIAAGASGGSGNADPPNATQSGSAQDTLVIATYGGGHVATVAPTGYSNLTTQTSAPPRREKPPPQRTA